MIKVKARMVAKEATAAEWTQSNPTLLAGEFGYETDTHKLKIGQSGVAWNSLPYFYGGATLPSVTSSDDGAILVVNNGDWDVSSAPVFQIVETQGYPQDPVDGFIYYDSTYNVYYACTGGNLQVILTEAMMDMDPSDPPTARLPKMGVAGQVYRLGDLFIDSDSGGTAEIDWEDLGSQYWVHRFLCVRDPLGQYLYTICGDQTNLWTATAPDNTWTTLSGIALEEDVQSIQQWGDQLFIVTPSAVYTASVTSTAAGLEWSTYDLPLHQASGTWTYICYCFNKYFLISDNGTANNVLVSTSLSDPTWDDVVDLASVTKLNMPLFASNTLMIPSEDECYDTTDGTVWYNDSYGGYSDFSYFGILGDYFIAIHTDIYGTIIMHSNNAYQWEAISTGIPNVRFPYTIDTDGSQIIIAGNVGRFMETGYSITTDFQNFTWCPNNEFGQEVYMYHITGNYWYVLSYNGIGLMSLETAGGILTNGSGADVTDQMKKIILPDPGTVGQVMTNVGGKWQAANPANGQLPIVTTADAGKFLQVNDQGQWAAVYVPEGTGEYF